MSKLLVTVSVTCAVSVSLSVLVAVWVSDRVCVVVEILV